MPVAYVKVKLEFEKGEDIDDIITECDYEFKHDSINDTEIRDYYVKENEDD